MRTRLRAGHVRQALGAVLAGAAAAAPAQAAEPSALQWNAGVGIAYRRLTEETASGNRLLTERGPMARVEVGAVHARPTGAAYAAEAGLAAGRLDYDGQTQAGAALTTDSRHRDADLTLLWRPHAPAGWGEAWVLLRVERQHRDIASTARATGLRETSTLVMPGVRWRGAPVTAVSWQWRPELEARVSAYHRLEVDYNGLFDRSRLEGGRRWALAAGVAAQLPHSPWQVGLRWTHARQRASESETISRSGRPVGSVRQPRLGSDDLALTVRRDF